MPVFADITLGRYVAADSCVHRLDPRTKLLGTMVAMAAALAAPGFGPLLLYVGFVVAAAALTGLPPRLLWGNLRPFLWLFLFTLLLHALMTPGETLVVVPWLDQPITRQGCLRGLFYCLRLAVVMVTAALLTLTTAPMALSQALERLLRPLARLGVPVGELALMVTIALRFIPVLMDEAERLRQAQLARGADFGGNPVRRARSLIPLLVPLFVSAFARADRLALAMESRCYRSGAPRTHLHELRYTAADAVAASAVLLMVFGLWLLASGQGGR